jgi:hypothetical protein
VFSEDDALVENFTIARASEDVEANLLVVARIIDFVEFVAGAEFRADGVADEFEVLDALRGGDGRAATIFSSSGCRSGFRKSL